METFKSYFSDFKLPEGFNEDIYFRKRRTLVNGFKHCYKFIATDIIKIVYLKNTVMHTFEGICLSVKKRQFLMPNTSVVLRNIFMGVGMEVTVAFYYHRLYGFFIQDYKRKSSNWYKSKFFYIRKLPNSASNVKT